MSKINSNRATNAYRTINIQSLHVVEVKAQSNVDRIEESTNERTAPKTTESKSEFLLLFTLHKHMSPIPRQREAFHIAFDVVDLKVKSFPRAFQINK